MTRRLLLSYFLLTGFVLLVLEIPLGFSLAHNAEHDMLGGVGHDTTVLATLVEDTVEQRQVSAIAGPAGDYARRVGGRVVVVGSTGTTLFDSGHPSGAPEDFSNRPEIRQALAGASPTGVRYSATLGYDLAYASAPVASGGKVYGAVRITYSAATLVRQKRRVWLILVFPACILSYMGQGALVLGDPASIRSPFFLLVPGWARLPMVFLAAAATVIASQAVITGAFSVAHQAAQLGYLPRLRIVYTSEERMGQIYIPLINWLLLVSVLTLVVTFKSSAALAYAYGTAVTGTITITTLLFFYVARYQWHTPLWIVAPGAGSTLVIQPMYWRRSEPRR